MIIDLNSSNGNYINIPMTHLINNVENIAKNNIIYSKSNKNNINSVEDINNLVSTNIPFKYNQIPFAEKVLKESDPLENCIYKPTMCINYKQSNCSSIISINGPSEARLRYKTKTDCAYIEVLTTFNSEIDKLKQNLINNFLKNFCETVIKCDEYPRCLISISISVMLLSNEIELKKHLINGVMLSLILSGIDLYSTSLAVLVPEVGEEIDRNSSIVNYCLVVLDVNNNEEIILLDSINPIKYNLIDKILKQAEDLVKFEFDVLKKLIVSLTSQ